LSPLVIAFGAFGFVIALFAIALQKQASLAKKWPVVTGTIRLSGLEQYRAARTDGRRGQVMYQRKVSYSYTYNGNSYTSMQASLASNVASSSGWLMSKFTKAYQDGAQVKVWVNPDNPSEATLEQGIGVAWVLWVLVAGFAGLTYYTAIHG
jgi:hypothetical protein